MGTGAPASEKGLPAKEREEETHQRGGQTCKAKTRVTETLAASDSWEGGRCTSAHGNEKTKPNRVGAPEASPVTPSLTSTAGLSDPGTPPTFRQRPSLGGLAFSLLLRPLFDPCSATTPHGGFIRGSLQMARRTGMVQTTKAMRTAGMPSLGSYAAPARGISAPPL